MESTITEPETARGEYLTDRVIHVVGVVLGIVGSAILLRAVIQRRHSDLVPASIYVFGLLSMLGFSAAYNLWPPSPIKSLLRRFDHSAIYLLIAATYTPIIWHVEASFASTFLTFVWTTALVGVVLKLRWPDRFFGVSVGLYLVLGWSGVLAYRTITQCLPAETLWLVALGGISYTLGVPIHLWNTLRYHTAVWHGFVLAAASLHYFAVWMLLASSN